jgi:uncharacterized protein YbaR (Trm112 family)
VLAIYLAVTALVNGNGALRTGNPPAYIVANASGPACGMGSAMRLDDDLLSLLACPVSKQPLVYFPAGEAEHPSAFLFSPAAKLIFPIDVVTGLPVLLTDEAKEVSDAEVVRLTERGRAIGVPTGHR